MPLRNQRESRYGMEFDHTGVFTLYNQTLSCIFSLRHNAPSPILFLISAEKPQQQTAEVKLYITGMREDDTLVIKSCPGTSQSTSAIAPNVNTKITCKTAPYPLYPDSTQCWMIRDGQVINKTFHRNRRGGLQGSVRVFSANRAAVGVYRCVCEDSFSHKKTNYSSRSVEVRYRDGELLTWCIPLFKGFSGGTVLSVAASMWCWVLFCSCVCIALGVRGCRYNLAPYNYWWHFTFIK